jgi:hypothetical protein
MKMNKENESSILTLAPEEEKTVRSKITEVLVRFLDQLDNINRINNIFFILFLVSLLLVVSTDKDKYVSCLPLFPSSRLLSDSRKMGVLHPKYCAVTTDNTWKLTLVKCYWNKNFYIIFVISYT